MKITNFSENYLVSNFLAMWNFGLKPIMISFEEEIQYFICLSCHKNLPSKMFLDNCSHSFWHFQQSYIVLLSLQLSFESCTLLITYMIDVCIHHSLCKDSPMTCIKIWRNPKLGKIVQRWIHLTSDFKRNITIVSFTTIKCHIQQMLINLKFSATTIILSILFWS